MSTAVKGDGAICAQLVEILSRPDCIRNLDMETSKLLLEVGVRGYAKTLRQSSKSRIVKELKLDGVDLATARAIGEAITRAVEEAACQ